jgi:ABC-type sugar transport system ATPase subunit
MLAVDQAEYMGATSLLQGSLPDGTRIDVMLQQALNIQRGASVELVLDTHRLHCFDAQDQRIER